MRIDVRSADGVAETVIIVHPHGEPDYVLGTHDLRTGATVVTPKGRFHKLTAASIRQYALMFTDPPIFPPAPD